MNIPPVGVSTFCILGSLVILATVIALVCKRGVQFRITNEQQYEVKDKRRFYKREP